jgi:dTDP-4-dehydrorhamnose reductase
LRDITNDAIFASRTSPVKIELSNADILFDRLSSINPDLIINAAGFTSVDRCESEKREAYLINGLSLKEIVRYCRVRRKPLIHISTDYVFDGNDGNYNEESIPNPINFYGLSKLIGDTFALSYDESLVVRTSGVFGSSKNFPMFVVEALKRKESVPVIEGYYSPIFSDFLARAVIQLIDSGKRGLLNVAGERVSRMHFAELIANKFNLNKNLLVPSKGRMSLAAKRPYDSSLDITRAKGTLKFDFFTISRNLDEFYKKLNKGKQF